MRGRNKKTVTEIIIISLLIITAILCRNMWRFTDYSSSVYTAVSAVRSTIYIGMFAAWGYSVRRRILQTQVRRYLLAISALLIFWMSVRTLKFMDIFNTDGNRFLWYLFYLPMLFIPTLTLLTAFSLGKPEGFRLPEITGLMYIPAAALLLLVLTNDLHRLVFSFSADSAVMSDSSYTYGDGYYFVLGWEIACILSALVIMMLKCRVPHSKKFFPVPFILFGLMMVYSLLYALKYPVIYVAAGDITVVFCLFTCAIFESCIRCGLVQSNSNYDELFRITGIRAKITDNDYNIILSSTDSQALPKEIMRMTKSAPVMFGNGIRLCGAPIKNGHVLWSEDVTELTRILAELRDTNESIEDDNALLSAEYKLKAREAHIAEQDRLYNEISRQTARQISLLSDLTEEFEKSVTEEEKIRLLGKMIVIGAYLKRRNNLIFVADKTPFPDIKELQLAFNESLDNLELCGITCGFRTDLSGKLPAEHIMAMYDFFEEITELSADSFSAVHIVVTGSGKDLHITVNTDSANDLSVLTGDNITVIRDEDGEWQLTMYPGGGNK